MDNDFLKNALSGVRRYLLRLGSNKWVIPAASKEIRNRASRSHCTLRIGSDSDGNRSENVAEIGTVRGFMTLKTGT